VLEVGSVDTTFFPRQVMGDRSWAVFSRSRKGDPITGVPDQVSGYYR